jgi:hypothetical protein
MRTPVYLIIGVLFMGFAVAVWAGLLFPRMPQVGYLRFMIGLVLALMGVHRCLLGLFPPSAHTSRRDSLHSWRKPQ